MQCAELVRREVMGAELLNTGVWHDVCARGLVRTLPISPQDVQPRAEKNCFVPGRVYRAVSLFRASGRALTVPPSWFCNRAAAV